MIQNNKDEYDALQSKINNMVKYSEQQEKAWQDEQIKLRKELQSLPNLQKQVENQAAEILSLKQLSEGKDQDLKDHVSKLNGQIELLTSKNQQLRIEMETLQNEVDSHGSKFKQ